MKQLPFSEALYDYALAITAPEHAVLKALREETAKHSLAAMQISPLQGQFMQFLLHVLQAKKVLELGTFTGYSALAMALALPEDGEVITCDINLDWTKHCHAYWQQAGQNKKITLKIAPALDTLQQLVDDKLAGTFDFIFIDADKTNYVQYYEFALQLIKPTGIIAIDNIFWGGKVIAKQETGAQTREIRKLNEHIKNDSRVTTCLLPIDDGLFLVKRNGR